MKPILGLTMGDPAGIGPELCLRALREPSVLAQCVPVLFGDAAVLQRLDNSPTYEVLSPAQWSTLRAPQHALVVDCGAMRNGVVRPGEIAAACGRAAFVYIEHAIGAALSGRIEGVVTAPIHKEALRLAGIAHPGHTEIFTDLTRAPRSCMMLYSDVLTVSMVTTHIGFAEVPANLSVQRITDVIELTAEAMHWMLGRAPRLGICGLNPHAGEHGLFGQREEERIVMPAVRAGLAKGLLIEPPLPPDTAFTTAARERYDAIITLYHDQGHIPFKMLAFDTGVNITLGLPIIRTSVDHGTAFDIAWKGVANATSLFAAIGVAARMASGRQSGTPA
jgi:4-phospho-D-threonate 3-dehydrogenase / 4-phospho-D-erythronate 3-dehydrogenase